MNKRWFHPGLFKEGLRQTRLIALIGTIVILAFTGLIWLAIFTDEVGYANLASPSLYDFPLVGAVLIAQYCIFSPLMVLFLYRYLNRRESSDFYHTIPHTREALHISYFAAIMLWNLISTAAVTGLIFLLYGLCPFMVINLSTVLPYLFNMFSAQFLVAASVLFAMSITGTGFTNVVVSILVIFVPRLVLYAVTNMVQNYCVIADIATQFPLLNPALNVASGLPITLLMALFSGDDSVIMDCLTNPRNGLYTFVLALILLAAGLVLLHHRKSETAGKSSPSRFLQAVYRITFGAVLGLIPVYVAYNAILWNDFDRSETLIALLALVMGAALFYFLFELIATKKAKNLLRAIPGLVIFLVIDALLLSASFAIGRGVLSFTPTAEEIISITVTEDEDNYFVNKSGSVKLADTTAKTVAAKVLSETVELVNDRRLHRGVETIYGYYQEAENTLKIDYQTKSGWQQRYVVLGDADYQQLIDCLQTNQNYKKCFYELPDAKQNNVILSIDTHYWKDLATQLSEEKQLSLYNTFLEEVQSLSFEQWYPIAINSHHGASSQYLASINLEIAKGSRHDWIGFGIDETLFPKTTAQFLAEYQSVYPQALQDARAFMEEIQEENLVMYTDYSINLTVHSPRDCWLNIPEEELFGLIDQILQQAEPYNPGGSQSAISIDFCLYQKDDWPSIMVAVDPALLEPYCDMQTDDLSK